MDSERNRTYKSACDAFGNPFINPSAEAAIVRHVAFRKPKPEAPVEEPAVDPAPDIAIETTGAERSIIDLTSRASVTKVE